MSIQSPAWPHSLIHMHEQLEDAIPANVLETVEIWQHNYAEKKPLASKFKENIIEFPNGQVLSAKVLDPNAGENEEIEMELIEVEYDRNDGSDLTNSETWGYWIVAHTDKELVKKGKVQAKEKKSKLALKKEQARLAKMKLKHGMHI